MGYAEHDRCIVFMFYYRLVGQSVLQDWSSLVAKLRASFGPSQHNQSENSRQLRFDMAHTSPTVARKMTGESPLATPFLKTPPANRASTGQVGPILANRPENAALPVSSAVSTVPPYPCRTELDR